MSSTFDVYSPATGTLIAQVPDTDSAQWLAALGDAEKAGTQWAAKTPRERSVILTQIFERVMAAQEEIAQLIHAETGKPYAEALSEVSYCAEYFRWYAEEAVRFPGRFAQAPGGTGHIAVTRRPVGPVLAITPWNFPVAMATRKIAPALAAGCSILVKPAALTPLSLLKVGEIITEVLEEFGVDPTLVAFLPTTKDAELSATLMADPRLKKITFTGSTRVGKILVEQSAAQLLRTSMELGGNAAFVIDKEADIDAAVAQAIAAKMRNAGQACIAANRFIVHEERAEEFTQKLAQAMTNTEIGPIISEAQRARIQELIDDARQRGAEIVIGGEIPAGPGYFYPATVVRNVSPDARILHEEIFGPVAPILTVNSLEEAVQLANDTEFGLAAYGFSQNIAAAQYLAEHLRAGMIGINRGAISDPAAPFGGIGQSGFGREGGPEGLEEYTATTYLALP